MRMGITPHTSDMKSSACSLGVVAIMGCFGRNRDTRLALVPDHVGVMMAPALISFAIQYVDRLMESLVLASSALCSNFETLSPVSAERTMRSIITTASTGYFPAAVSSD